MDMYLSPIIPIVLMLAMTSSSSLTSFWIDRTVYAGGGPEEPAYGPDNSIGQPAVPYGERVIHPHGNGNQHQHHPDEKLDPVVAGGRHDVAAACRPRKAGHDDGQDVGIASVAPHRAQEKKHGYGAGEHGEHDGVFDVDDQRQQGRRNNGKTETRDRLYESTSSA